VSRGEFNTDRFLFSAVMAVCALASARARDGSLYSSRWNVAQLKDPPSETFYEIAKDSMPINNTLSNITARDHNCMRACAILAITNIQLGQMRLFHQNLLRYHAIVAMDGLHDEANWPKDMGIVEIEERRRLVSLFQSAQVHSCWQPPAVQMLLGSPCTESVAYQNASPQSMGQSCSFP
jgi:hypothetical protein